MNCPTAGVTGKGGIWRTKPPDAESASWSRFSASAGKAPHLSGARGVGQVLQATFEFELDIFIRCIYRWAHSKNALLDGYKLRYRHHDYIIAHNSILQNRQKARFAGVQNTQKAVPIIPEALDQGKKAPKTVPIATVTKPSPINQRITRVLSA